MPFSAIVLLAAVSLQGQTSAPVNFQREIRTILSSNCFACHGPDKGTRMAGLRLDRRQDAMAVRKTGAAVVPGNPSASVLFQRLTDPNPARRMPSASSHKELSKAEIETLRRWIAQGAKWEEHWAFQAPQRPAPPEVRNQAWSRNPIDRFLMAKLEAVSLAPAAEADRRTLARRVALDLTGLPPKPADVEEFVDDNALDAYEKYVDKTMASPHWGEHRGRYWLDAARYADTHGIHVDNYREMWPYRDWVINAFNRNVPFDRFTIEQVAGDLLPNRTLEQQIASGFHRCNTTTNEAGIIIEEVQAMYAKDRVDTTGTVFLGLTIGCATCHDHKFDPLSQRDFYSLSAFFRNLTQDTMDGNVPDTPPVVVVPREEDRLRWASLNEENAALRARMAEARKGGDEAFEQWLKSPARRGLKTPLEGASQLFAFDPAAASLEDGPVLGDSDVGGRKAIHFPRESAVEVQKFDAIQPGKPFSLAVKFYLPKREESFVVASQSDPEDRNRGWVVEIGARVSAMRMVGDDGRAIQIRAGHLEQLKHGSWNTLVFTYDGSRDQSGFDMFQNGRAIPTQGRGDVNTKLMGSFRNGLPLRLGNERQRFLTEGAIAEFRVFDRVLNEEEARLVTVWPVMAASLDKARLSADERDAFRLYYLTHRNRPYREMQTRLAAVEGERMAVRRRGAVTHVMEDRAGEKPFAHVLYRGMYDKPRDRVEPDVPAVLPPMKASLPRNRLGLAQWLVDPANPLTARVAVNRFWQEVFGTGIVKSADDFGSQGLPPSHPELLDWLAVEFRESGWDVKKLFNLMVTSAAYRQSAQATPQKLAQDPENRLLSRGPRFRMDGELVRDYALAASGLLRPTIGGPSVKPYQPEGVWESVAMIGSNTRYYQEDRGDDLYRRSMYWFWKRAAPPASMEVFNAPTREGCTVKRERTNTPLQALVTMNDVQFVEAARHLAQRALKAERNFDGRLDFVSARVVSRPLETREREAARAAYKDYLRYYDSHPDAVQMLLAVGEAKAEESVNAAECAAMTMVANQILNLDEVLSK